MNTRNFKSGFTLVEVLLAAVILSTVVVVVMQSISSSASSSRLVVALDNARILAADKLNRASADPSLSFPVEGDETFANIEYKWKVEKVDSSDSSRKQLVCIVSWPSGSQTKSLNLVRTVPSSEVTP